ncbi:MAG: putative Fe-S cluster assembly protein SufT, partial [Gammaproteobacteria bacterium]
MMGERLGDIEHVALTRDCEAVVVPWGHASTLRAGSTVQITQQLGGSFTVMAGGNLYRISGTDADALGVELEPA